MAKWLSGGWKYRTKITIDYTKFSSTLTHFPIMLRISASCGASAQDLTAVFDELGANSLKLAVTKSDGTTELYAEVEKWDNVGEEAILWISKSDWTISHTANTVIYLYYDQHHADNSSYVGVVGSTPGKAVWDSNFKEVLHQADGADTGHVTGSVTGTSYSKKGANEPIEATGKIGKGQSYDGIDDYINLGNPVALQITDELTIEFIAQFNSVQPAAQFSNPLGKDHSGTAGVTLQPDHTVGNSQFWHVGNGSNLYSLNYNLSIASFFDNQYHLLGLTKSRTSGMAIWRDGVSTSSNGGMTTGISYAAGNWNFGRLANIGTRIGKFIGDELRFSNTARSTAWLAATYSTCFDQINTFVAENLTSPALWDFATFG